MSLHFDLTSWVNREPTDPYLRLSSVNRLILLPKYSNIGIESNILRILNLVFEFFQNYPNILDKFY